MQERRKNGKLIGSVLLLVLLSVLVMIKSDNTKYTVIPTPTPEVPLILENVWLSHMTETELFVLHDGEENSYSLKQPLETTLSECIIDLVVEQGYVTKITVKQDKIAGKVLRIGEDFIELEGYGCLLVDKNSRVYQVYDETVEKSWSDVLVGYTTSSFVLSDNTICAVLIEEPVSVTSIRVLIQNSSYGGYYHETLECGSETKFYLSDGSEKTQWYEPNHQIKITTDLVESYGGRIYIGTEKEEGKLSLFNVKRAVGVPSYRGTMEVVIAEGKLLVINELSLEEYLYGVLPSEMPARFGKEALKAQAVCARSYACNQLLANSYSAYGAHVDDSMNCQVYQNYGENDDAIEAVKATFGKIIEKDGKYITTYYFSCSYGHTSSNTDVWTDNTGIILNGVVQAKETVTESLTENKAFTTFLNSDRTWYDEDSVWFRWNTVIGSEIEEKILVRLQERQKAVPDMILIKTGEDENGMRFVQGKPEKFGKLKDIIVVERGESGIIKKLLLVGTQASYLIQKEYNIRYILAPVNIIYLKDGSTTSNMTLLPSAYFTVEKEDTYFKISGGGHGHGVGMSQYGAKYMASIGKTYEEILNHFYVGTSLVYLYQ